MDQRHSRAPKLLGGFGEGLVGVGQSAQAIDSHIFKLKGR